MAFPIPILDEAHSFLIALHKAHFPDIDVSEMSDAWLELRTLAGAVTMNNAHVSATQNDLMPDTATGTQQIRWGEFRGVKKKTATPARKDQAMRVFGAATTPVPADIEWNHVSGLRFRTGGPSVVGAQGYVDLNIASIDVGSATRLNATETLTINGATPAGLDEEGRLVLALDEGGDNAETEEAYRSRILSRWANGALGGAQEDYVQWALEELGIAAAYAYPLRAGLGTVHLAALHEGSGNARVLTAPEVAALQAKIDLKRPVGMKGFRVLQVIPEDVDVEIKVMADGLPDHAFDWDDTNPPVSATYDAPTRTVTLTAPRPSSMLAGHRVTFEDGATGKERVIESLVDGDKFVLEVDETGDVTAGAANVYSGGPLVQPAREAILDLIDGLGTANTDAKRYGAWEGNLRTVALGRVVTSVAGILDRELVAPVANVEADDPAYPDDDEIGLITPGQILVRELH